MTRTGENAEATIHCQFRMYVAMLSILFFKTRGVRKKRGAKRGARGKNLSAELVVISEMRGFEWFFTPYSHSAEGWRALACLGNDKFNFSLWMGGERSSWFIKIVASEVLGYLHLECFFSSPRAQVFNCGYVVFWWVYFPVFASCVFSVCLFFHFSFPRLLHSFIMRKLECLN